MTPIDWILSDDTGTSSKTIWSVMMGARNPNHDIPYDPADFGRCYRLLQRFPAWRERLPEVASEHKAWGPMVDAWDDLQRLYESEMHQKSAPKTYAAMKKIVEQCRLADGWRKTDFGWERP